MKGTFKGCFAEGEASFVTEDALSEGSRNLSDFGSDVVLETWRKTESAFRVDLSH